MQANIFFQSTCPNCFFPAILQFTPDQIEMRRTETCPHCTTQCAACGSWYYADVVLGPGLVNVQAALARTCALLEERLRATRGDLDASRHEGQRLRDEVWARGGRLRASQQEEQRLQAVVEARDIELREAKQRERILQEELLEARRKVEHLRATRDKQRSREEILQWQLVAARAEAQELRDEVARLEGEASEVGGLPGGRHRATPAEFGNGGGANTQWPDSKPRRAGNVPP